MKTSYFAKAGEDENAVCIALFPPKWHPNIRQFPTLAPTKSILKKWKASKDGSGPKYTEEQYAEDYNNEVLRHLDPRETWEALGGDAILCCFEKESFCHRHLVADWFERHLGITVPERKYENN